MSLYKFASCIFSILLASSAQSTYSQMMLGSSGGFNMPTTEIMPGGTLKAGINYVSNGLIDGDPSHPSHWNLDYNTGIYHISVSPCSWMEFTFRETLLKTIRTGDKKEGYFRQDRSISAKVRPLKETENCPAILFGITDSYSDEHNIYGSMFGVLSKSIHSTNLASTWIATAGYIYALPNLSNYDGVIASLQFRPDWFKAGTIGIEYDSKGINVGIQALLFNHVNLYVFTRDFTELSAGISYQYTIKY